LCVSWAGLEAKALSEKPLKRCSRLSVHACLVVANMICFTAAQYHLIDGIATENEDCYMAETMHKTYAQAAVGTVAAGHIEFPKVA